MSSYRLCFCLVLIIQTCVVYGQTDNVKSSLTFLIDDTASMADEIHQVYEKVDVIVKKVLSSNASHIDNFVLATFNDPDTQLRTITKDLNEIKTALAGIRVHGGNDCPEYAMQGISLGLIASLPLSYLYVLLMPQLRTMRDLKRSRVWRRENRVFIILTGECYGKGEDYQVYQKMAEATSGQVFRMMKDDVKDILKYIAEYHTSRRVTLVNKKLSSGYGIKITYPVDSYIGDLLISVTGQEPSIGVITGPDGSKLTAELIVSGKKEVVIVKVQNSKPGVYEVELGSKSDTFVVITGKSDINIQLGFSVHKPTSMEDTVTVIGTEGNAFLGIKLLGNGVTLSTAKILDMSDNVISELPLEIVDENAQFYATPSFDPPSSMFKVSVIGYGGAESQIVRTGATPITRQGSASS